ncbi:MAG: PepSY domain-containing protein [Magnetospirillum sp.]|nr:PepSY domain-containing protein [Magnetospirillum sp.]
MLKRLLFKIHRWAGVALALVMVLWLASGLVIVYAGSLPASRGEQLAHGQTLAPEEGWLSLGEAWQRSAEARKIRNGGTAVLEGRLTRVDGQPVWQVEDERGQRFALSAIDGAVLNFSGPQAERIAQAWLGQSADVAQVRFVDTQPAYSSLRNYTALKPFHRVAVDDGAGTEVLVSARSGDVLQVANRWERGLFLAGNWLHMFRFLDGLGLEDSRRDVLTWAGGLAFAAGLSGLIVGWLVWRPGWGGRATYSQGRTQPYRAFWFRWHFWSGLIGGTVAVLWAFSGYLVNNPFQLFSAATASRDEVARYYDRQLPEVAAQWRPAPWPRPAVPASWN